MRVRDTNMDGKDIKQGDFMGLTVRRSYRLAVIARYSKGIDRVSVR